jgi:hypothetical protein
MKFENFMQKKNAMLETLKNSFQGSKSLNENVQYRNMQPLNESTVEELFKKMKAYMTYGPALEFVEGEWKDALAAKWQMKEKSAMDILKFTAAIEKLEKIRKTVPREKSEQFSKKISQLQAKKDALSEQSERIQKQVDEKYRVINDEKLADLVADLKAAPELETVVSRKKSELTAQWTENGIEHIKVKEARLKATNDKTRLDKLEKDKQEAEKKYEDAVAKFKEAEELGEEDLKEIDGIESVEQEVKNLMKAGEEFGLVRKQLADLFDEAKAYDTDESADYDAIAKSAASLVEYDSSDYDYLNEEEETSSATPGEVLSKIMGLDDSMAAQKSELLTSLDAIAKNWKDKKIAKAEAKEALWNKVKNGAKTKTLIRIAGGTVDKNAEPNEQDLYMPTNTETPAGADPKPEVVLKQGEWNGENLVYKRKKKDGTGDETVTLSDLATEYKGKAKNAPKETKEETPEQKIQKLTDKGFDQVDVSDPEETKSVDIKDDQGTVTSTENKPKWKKGGEVDGKKYYKELLYDDKGKVTNESQRNTFKSKVLEKNSRIVPTFESFIQKYKNRF